MEKRYNKELQERTRAYVEAGTSQAELSRRLGMNNSSSLSRWLNSSYNGDVEKIEKALEEYFRAQEAAEEIAEKAAPYRPAVDYVPTSISPATAPAKNTTTVFIVFIVRSPPYSAGFTCRAFATLRRPSQLVSFSSTAFM